MLRCKPVGFASKQKLLYCEFHSSTNTVMEDACKKSFWEELRKVRADRQNIELC